MLVLEEDLLTDLSDEDDCCFIYPYDVSISSTGGSSSSYILDYSRSTSFYSAATALPVSVTYSLSGPSAFANGVRVWPYSSPTSAPRDFVWQGANSASATTWTNIITSNDRYFRFIIRSTT